MTIFEQSRYYFNYVLPDMIMMNLHQIDYYMGLYWWVFFIIAVILLISLTNSFRKNLSISSEFEKFNLFLRYISKAQELKEIESSILKSIELVKAKYGVVYELRGETYILIESNIGGNSEVSTPLRLRKNDLETFKKSGKFFVTYFLSGSEESLILFYSNKKVDDEKYRGFFSIMLNYYERVLHKVEHQGDKTISEITKSTSISLMKLHMDKYQFLKFFVALILKITKASGAKLFTKEGELVFEYKPSSDSTLQKTFYIRNTPYKLDFYDTKNLDMETIVKVGSFLDMSGAYLENIDKNSKMVKNYIDLLKFTTEAMELEHEYYKNHSLIVQSVAVEIAKSMFLDEEDIDNISIGAYLHDIGMVGDLLAILDKDDLNEKEFDLIREHPIIGSIIVEPINHIYPITDIIKYHHERVDGKGYPFGLTESEIPLLAQIVALAEFYAGITGDRSYKKGKSHEEAVTEIEKLTHKMFSVSVVKAFLDVENSLKTKIEKIKAG